MLHRRKQIVEKQRKKMLLLVSCRHQATNHRHRKIVPLPKKSFMKRACLWCELWHWICNERTKYDGIEEEREGREGVSSLAQENFLQGRVRMGMDMLLRLNEPEKGLRSWQPKKGRGQQCTN